MLAAGMAFAQAGGGGGGGGGRRARRMMDFIDIRTQLGVTDEEWNVLQPKIEKVMSLNRAM